MCGISITRQEISNMKKHKFKNLVYTQLRKLSWDYLIDLKAKHSKLDYLSNVYKLEQYLTSDKISTIEKQTLFKLRTRMVDVKTNFKTHYGHNLACRFCPEDESQAHLLSCNEIIKGVDVTKVEYDDIFKNIEKQEAVAKVFTAILKSRSLKL